MTTMKTTCFGSNFIEKNFSNIVNYPAVALAEIVANAWDAGATEIKITITPDDNDLVTIEDNGMGMSENEFLGRWNILRYNRDTSPIRVKNKSRTVFGKNGIGRFALFCFADQYNIAVSKDGRQLEYTVAEIKESTPSILDIQQYNETKSSKTGVKYQFISSKCSFTNELVTDVAKRFVTDPDFKIYLNGSPITLFELNGEKIYSNENESIIIYNVQSEESRRLAFKGIAFWVSNRLVGKPSWFGFQDGRTTIPRNNSYIVMTKGYENLVKEDWADFHENKSEVNELKEIAFTAIKKHLNDLWKDTKETNKQEHIETVKFELAKLPIKSRERIAGFVSTVYDSLQSPPDKKTVDAAVSAIIIQEKSSSGQELLNTIACMKSGQIDKLNNVLNEWNVDDIQKILFEIDSRLKIIEAIERIRDNKNIDELHVLHPLVLESRWLFGPEYDSAEYTSNKSVTTCLKKFFMIKSSASISKRPDIVIAPDSSLCNFELCDFTPTVAVPKNLLLLELKKGDFPIGRDEMLQADEYITLLNGEAGIYHEVPTITSYVVGNSIKQNTEERMIGKHRIIPTTYNHLVITAKKRMLNIRDKITKYDTFETHELLKSIQQNGVPITIDEFLCKDE